MSRTNEICQSYLGVAPWMDPLAARLPGLQPVQPGEWLQRDDAFDGQRDEALQHQHQMGTPNGDTHKMGTPIRTPTICQSVEGAFRAGHCVWVGQARQFKCNLILGAAVTPEAMMMQARWLLRMRSVTVRVA